MDPFQKCRLRSSAVHKKYSCTRGQGQKLAGEREKGKSCQRLVLQAEDGGDFGAIDCCAEVKQLQFRPCINTARLNRLRA